MTINSPQNLQNKILVVDDDPAIRNLVFRFLSFNDYQVETAEDAKTARHLFKEFHPDLVILDVNLPDDSGFNLCKEMRNSQTIILMLTSLSDTNYVLEKKHRAMWQNLWIKDSSFKIGFLFKNEALLEGAQASATSAAARQGYFILVVLDPFAKMKRKKMRKCNQVFETAQP